MNSICLSVAPNLRCQGLTRIENIVLLIPPAIELVFSLTLAFNHSTLRGWRRWILVLDGFTFFCLALADLLAHLLDDVSSTVNYFKIVDIVIAGASFLPLLAYTLFLFLFARSNLIKLLPDRFSRVANFALFFIIPPIIAFNELGSLLGISYKVFPTPNKTLFLAVGFSTFTFQRLSLFFSSGALALLSLFQAALFCLCFIRLVRAFLDERRANSFKGEPQAPEEIHLFRGLGWLAAGLKLGAIETVVGFANISFAVAITRRALRLFGRGMIIIGIIKGLNIVEDFVKFETDVLARRGGSTRLKRISRHMISNPRNSTFREMSPQASTFHAAQSEKKKGRAGPSPLRLGAQSSFNRFDDATAPSKERVTVMYDGVTPPVLEMRFSAIDMDVHPLPPPQKAQLATVMEDPREDHSSIYTNTAVPEALRPSYIRPSYASPMAGMKRPVQKTNLMMTGPMQSRPNSTEAVRSPNPNLPQGVIPIPQRAVYADVDADWRRLTHNQNVQRHTEIERANSSSSNSSNGQKNTDVSPVNSIKRKPPPILTAVPTEYKEPVAAVDDNRVSQYALFADHRSSIYSSEAETDYEVDLRPVGSRAGTPGLTRHSTLETVLETPAAFGARGGLVYEGSPRQLRARATTRETNDAQAANYQVAAVDDRRQRRLLQMRRTVGAQSSRNEEVQDEETKSKNDRGASWLHIDPLSNLQALGSGRDPRMHAEIEDEDVSEAVLDEAWQRAGLTRLKSVSRVPVHTTPKAEQMFNIRSSMFAVEEDDLGLPASPEDVRRVSAVSASLRRPARLDSGVLGEEEKKLVRQGIQV